MNKTELINILQGMEEEEVLILYDDTKCKDVLEIIQYDGKIILKTR